MTSRRRIPVRLPRWLGGDGGAYHNGHFRISYDQAVILMRHPAFTTFDRVVMAMTFAALQDVQQPGGPFEYSTEKLADAVGASRQNVERQLRRLETTGFLTWQRGVASRSAIFEVPHLTTTLGVVVQPQQQV